MELFRLTREPRAGSDDELIHIVELWLPQHMDSSVFDRLNESLLAEIRAQPRGQWIVDLSHLSYMGSSALGLMINVRQQIKQAGGQLVLCGMNAKLHQVFRACCLERLFVVLVHREDAKRQMAR